MSLENHLFHTSKKNNFLQKEASKKTDGRQTGNGRTRTERRQSKRTATLLLMSLDVRIDLDMEAKKIQDALRRTGKEAEEKTTGQIQGRKCIGQKISDAAQLSPKRPAFLLCPKTDAPPKKQKQEYPHDERSDAPGLSDIL